MTKFNPVIPYSDEEEHLVTLVMNALRDPSWPGTSRDVARQIRLLIRAEIMAAMTPPEPEPSVLDEHDIIKHVYRTGMKDWGLQLIHEPTGISVLRDSSDGFKSLLQGTVDAMKELEGRVSENLARRSS
jgi:hypothetical protein